MSNTGQICKINRAAILGSLSPNVYRPPQPNSSRAIPCEISIPYKLNKQRNVTINKVGKVNDSTNILKFEL